MATFFSEHFFSAPSKSIKIKCGRIRHPRLQKKHPRLQKKQFFEEKCHLKDV